MLDQHFLEIRGARSRGFVRPTPETWVKNVNRGVNEHTWAISRIYDSEQWLEIHLTHETLIRRALALLKQDKGNKGKNVTEFRRGGRLCSTIHKVMIC